MKIIDFFKIGNVVRFYLGDDDDNKYWGDDWSDYPYECNAGEVYDEFIKGYLDIAFDVDHIVVEPQDGCYGSSNLSKEDFKNHKCPCIAVNNRNELPLFSNNFNTVVTNKTSIKFYFDDSLETLKNNIIAMNGVIIKTHYN